MANIFVYNLSAHNFQPMTVYIFYLEPYHSSLTWNEHEKLCSNYRFTSLKKKRFSSKGSGLSNDRYWLYLKEKGLNISLMELPSSFA